MPKIKKWAMKAKEGKAWIKALESGEYKKCTGALWDGEEQYCAIGVLGHQRDKLSLGETAIIESVLSCGEADELANKIMRKNDEHRHSFKRIAGWIKENVALVPEKKTK